MVVSLGRMMVVTVSPSELEQSLAVMGSHVDSLQLSTDRLRARVRWGSTSK